MAHPKSNPLKVCSLNFPLKNFELSNLTSNDSYRSADGHMQRRARVNEARRVNTQSVSADHVGLHAMGMLELTPRLTHDGEANVSQDHAWVATIAPGF